MKVTTKRKPAPKLLKKTYLPSRHGEEGEMSREEDYLRRKGWIKQGTIQRGCFSATCWYKDGMHDGCQQWEALEIQRKSDARRKEKPDAH